MKNKEKIEKYSLHLLEIPNSEFRSQIEVKFCKWFPHLSPSDIQTKLYSLPFIINDLPIKIAKHIQIELEKLNCKVKIINNKVIVKKRKKRSNFSSIPPVKPRAKLKDFFSSSYLSTFVKPKSQGAEAFRTLRTNFKFIRNTKQIRSLLITSSTEGEGKSTIASNLAISIAQAGNKVLLVDADIRLPSLHFALGDENKFGLSNLLRGQKSLSECVAPTFIKNLSLIYSGPLPANPAELLEHERMGKLIEKMVENFDLVILDSPPLTSVADSAILSNLVDGIYLVIYAGKTSRKVIRYSIDILKGVNAPILGTILNNFNFMSHYYYYKKYYSGYVDYVKENDTSRKKKLHKKNILNVFRNK